MVPDRPSRLIAPCLALLLCLAAAAAPAEPSGRALARLGAAWEAPALDLAQGLRDAIGRLNRAGFNVRGNCSGSLVAPDLVLTAAHCTQGIVAEARDIHTFAAGWDRGRVADAADTASAAIHPDYSGGLGLPALGVDLSVATLARPLDDAIAPLPLGPPPRRGERLIPAGYPIARSHILRLQGPCRVTAVIGRVALIDCEPEGGQSGGPLLRLTPTGAEVAAVMVARGEGVGIAAIPDDWVRAQVGTAATGRP